MDNKTYIDMKNKELNKLDYSLFILEFIYIEEHNKEIKEIKKKIESIEHEIYCIKELNDV